MLVRIETTVLGFNAVLHRVWDGINIELVGGADTLSQLADTATQVANALGGIAERSDHPGASHIYLVRIPRTENDLEVFENEMKSGRLIP